MACSQLVESLYTFFTRPFSETILRFVFEKEKMTAKAKKQTVAKSPKIKLG